MRLTPAACESSAFFRCCIGEQGLPCGCACVCAALPLLSCHALPPATVCLLCMPFALAACVARGFDAACNLVLLAQVAGTSLQSSDAVELPAQVACLALQSTSSTGSCLAAGWAGVRRGRSWLASAHLLVEA
jgi:hypothetical protein